MIPELDDELERKWARYMQRHGYQEYDLIRPPDCQGAPVSPPEDPGAFLESPLRVIGVAASVAVLLMCAGLAWAEWRWRGLAAVAGVVIGAWLVMRMERWRNR